MVLRPTARLADGALRLRWRRQQVVEMASPARRIVALSEAADRGPAQHAFDAPAHPARGLRLDGPDRLKRFHDKRRIDRVNREIGEHGVGVAGQCRGPLLRMDGVFPTGPVRGDVGLGALPESHSPGSGKPRLIAAGTSGQHRVLAVEAQLALLGRRLPRVGERDIRPGAKPEVGLLLADAVAIDPRLRAGRADAQIEALAIRV